MRTWFFIDMLNVCGIDVKNFITAMSLASEQLDFRIEQIKDLKCAKLIKDYCKNSKY